MRTNALVVFAAAAVVAAIVSCSKESLVQPATEQSTLLAKSEDPPVYKFPIHVKWRFRYEGQYPEQACSYGGECGGCPGMCVYWGGGKMLLNVDPPTREQLDEGIGRGELWLREGKLTVVPIDFPMDNGDGNTRLYAQLKADEDLAAAMGYSYVALNAGTYEVDYSNPEDLYGRAVFSSTLTP